MDDLIVVMFVETNALSRSSLLTRKNEIPVGPCSFPTNSCDIPITGSAD